MKGIDKEPLSEMHVSYTTETVLNAKNLSRQLILPTNQRNFSAKNVI
jgi:hypothetical protein